MGWLVSFATAALVWTVGADIHTLTEVPQKQGAIILKTVYVNGPALVKVEVSSTRSGSLSSEGHAIVFCPAGRNASHIVSCGPLHKPIILEEAQNISIFEISSPGPVWSRQKVLTETGAYDVLHASCADTAESLTITISGPNLSAHESGWGMHYACIGVVYAGLCLVWLRIRGKLDATREKLLSDVSFTSFVLLGMACAGFMVHVLPQKSVFVKLGFAGIISVAIATLMTTFLKMTAVGFEPFTATKWYFEIAWYVFAFCHLFALDLWATPATSGNAASGNANCILFPLIAGYAAFGVSCCFCLLRSAICLGKTERNFVSRIAAVVVIYTVLSMISACCRAYDVPSADPETWKSHYISEIVTQLTQAFGLVAALYVFQQGVPIHAPAKGDGCKKSYGPIDEEIPENIADDDQTAEQKSCISPVVYGVE